MKRTAFFISDSTGITAEVMGESLLSHFPNITFERHTLPYIDTPERAQEAADKINQAAAADGLAPIIFDTLIDQSISDIVKKSEGFFIGSSKFECKFEIKLASKQKTTLIKRQWH